MLQLDEMVPEPDVRPVSQLQLERVCDGLPPDRVIREDGNGDDRLPVTQMQLAVIFVHALRESVVLPRLEFDVNKDELLAAVFQSHLHDQVQLPSPSRWQVRERFLLQELGPSEVDDFGLLGHEQFHELLKEALQQRLENLVMVHCHIRAPPRGCSEEQDIDTGAQHQEDSHSGRDS